VKEPQEVPSGCAPPAYWEEARLYLGKQDPTLASLMDASFLRSQGSGFCTLVHSIVGQQISVKAAQKITERLQIAHPGDVQRFSPEDLLAAGLSRQKVTYIVGLAQFWKTEAWKTWPLLSDEALKRALITLKGVGPWTAEMFLIFHCRRPDVFPQADLGVQKAITTLYKISQEEILELSERWRPYRTVATWYLWRSLDAIPVEY
jgi:DNA-3-methyladenine glycosylase II